MSAYLQWRTEMGEQSEVSILLRAKRASSDVAIEGRWSGHVARRARRRQQRGWSYCCGINAPSVNQPESTRIGGQKNLFGKLATDVTNFRHSRVRVERIFINFIAQKEAYVNAGDRSAG